MVNVFEYVRTNFLYFQGVAELLNIFLKAGLLMHPIDYVLACFVNFERLYYFELYANENAYGHVLFFVFCWRVNVL